MPYFIQLPNNEYVEVPDDMPVDEARSRILRQFPQFNTAEARGRSFLERSIFDPIERGYQNVATGLTEVRGANPNAFYGLSEEEAAARIARRQRRLEEIPQTQASQDAFRRAQEADGILGAVGEIAGSRSAVGDIVAESIGANPLAGAVGVAANVTPVPVLRQILGGLAGALGFPTEFASSRGQALLSAARDAGVDPRDPQALAGLIREINADPERREEIQRNALIRAGIISSVDAAAGYGAGRLATRSAVPRIGGAAAIEGVGGGVGEAAAGLATEGSINPVEVAAEIVGGSAMGAAGNLTRAVDPQLAARSQRAAEDEELARALRDRAETEEPERPIPQLGTDIPSRIETPYGVMTPTQLMEFAEANVEAFPALQGVLDMQAGETEGLRSSETGRFTEGDRIRLIADVLNRQPQPSDVSPRDPASETRRVLNSLEPEDRALIERFFPDPSTFALQKPEVQSQFLAAARQRANRESNAMRQIRDEIAQLDQQISKTKQPIRLARLREAKAAAVQRLGDVAQREAEGFRAAIEQAPRMAADADRQIGEIAQRIGEDPVALVTSTLQVTEADFRRATPDARERLVARAQQLRTTQTPGRPLRSSFDASQAEGEASPPSRPNAPAFASEAVGQFEDTSRAASPTSAELEAQGAPTAAQIRQANDAQQRSDQEGQLLEALRGARSRVLDVRGRLTELRRAEATGTITPREQQELNRLEAELRTLDARINASMLRADGLSRRGGFGSQSASGTSDRPFAGFEEGRDAEATPGFGPDPLPGETQAQYLERQARERAQREQDAIRDRIFREQEARAKSREEAARDRADADRANAKQRENTKSPGKPDANGFYAVDEDGFLVNGEKLVVFSSKRAAANWMVPNRQAAYWDFVVRAANSEEVMLRAKPAYYADKAAAEADARADQPGQSEAPRAIGGPQFSALDTDQQPVPEAAQEASPDADRAERRARANAIIDARLERLKAMGKQGRLARNAVVAALKDRRFTPEQMLAAFRIAEAFTRVVGGARAVRLEFRQNLEDMRDQAGGVEPQALVEAIKNGPNGVEAVARFSLSDSNLPVANMTAPHEAFHVLQALFKGSEPKLAQILNRAFPAGKGLDGIDPTILRKLKTLRPTGSNQSYYDFLKRAISKEDRSDELQAYVFGALMDAQMRGEPMSGITPSIIRLVNYFAQMRRQVGALLRGDGVTASGIMERAGRGDYAGLERVQDTAGAQASAMQTGSEPARRKSVTDRDPILEVAARGIRDGSVTREQYEALVNERKPVTPYAEVPEPATREEITNALERTDPRKVPLIGKASETLKEGDPVGLRLDIPAYSKQNTWVVSVHEAKGKSFYAGTPIGYEPVAIATNVKLGVVEGAAMKIAAGDIDKATIAVMRGEWQPATPEEAKARADAALNDPSYAQVGMDPRRHQYFYDRTTKEPVVAADEVIQIGPLVLAKNPVYGNKSDYQFSAMDPAALRQFSAANPSTPLAVNRAWVNATSGMTRGEPPSTMKRAILGGIFGALPGEVDQAQTFAEGLEVAKRAFKRNTVNIAASVERLDQALASKGIPTVRKLSQLVEEARMNTGRMELISEVGGLGYDPVKQTIVFDKSVPSMLKALQGRVSDRDIGEFQKYLIARRESDLRKAGRKGLSNKADADIQAAIRLAEQQHPEWRDAAADIQKINKAMLDIAVKTGILDAARAKQLAGMMYTPFYRYAEADATGQDQADVIGPKLSQTLSNPAAFEKAVHDGGEIGDNLIANMLRNYDAILRSAMKNVAAREVASNMTKLTDANGKPLAERLNRSRQTGDQNVVITKENGQDVLYKINQPDIYLAMTGLPKAQRGAVFDTMAKLAGWFRIGITSAPSYMWANLWRGRVVAYAQEGLPLFSNVFRGAKEFYNASSSLTDFQAQTGFGGFTFGMGDSDPGADFMRALRAANGERRTKDLFFNFIDGLQKFSEATEMADRLLMAEHLMKKGVDPREARFQAYLLAPYSRHGLGDGAIGGTMQFLTPLVPFLNSKVQSLNRMVENDKGQRMIRTPLGFKMPADRVLRSLLLTTFSVGAYALAQATAPEQWEKENPDTILRYDIFYIAGQRILIPRAFEFGVAFGALPIFALEAIRKGDSDDLARAVALTMFSTYGFSPIPQAVVPLLEVATGYNFFQGRQLENQGQQALPAEERVSEGTSALARGASQIVMGTQRTVLPPNLRADFSPIAAQRLIEGYTGSLGVMVLGAVDSLLAGTGVLPERPSGVFGDPNAFFGLQGVASEFSGLKRFIRDQDEQVSRGVNDFYRMKKDLDQLVRSATLAQQAGDFDRVADIMSESGMAFGARGQLNRIGDQIGKLNRQIEMIRRQGGDPDDMRERLAFLREQRNMLADQGANLARAVGLR